MISNKGTGVFIVKSVLPLPYQRRSMSLWYVGEFISLDGVENGKWSFPRSFSATTISTFRWMGGRGSWLLDSWAFFDSRYRRNMFSNTAARKASSIHCVFTSIPMSWIHRDFEWLHPIAELLSYRMVIIGLFPHCVFESLCSRVARERMDMMRARKRNRMDPCRTICYGAAIRFDGTNTLSCMRTISTTLVMSWRSAVSYGCIFCLRTRESWSPSSSCYNNATYEWIDREYIQWATGILE